MKAQLPTAIFLDLDDTILDDTGSVARCWREACEQYAPQLGPFTPEEINDAIRTYSSWYWGDANRHRQGRLQLELARREIVEETLRRLGAERPEIAHQLADRYSVLREEAMEPFPGAIDALHRLRELEIRLALLTNGNAISQRRKIDKHQLHIFFEIILIEGEFGVGKPDKRVYLHALEQMKVRPAETWMVGDNLEWDVAGAQQAGILGIWHDFQGTGLPASNTVKPDRIIRSLTDLVT
ncbi:MAG: HAD family hydrolase [Anaerolineae bacterium]|nr:HAD family hydrolase [Anaerolineae bacterium]